MKTNPAAYARGLSDSKDLSKEEIDDLKDQVSKARKEIQLVSNCEEAFNDADFVIEAIAEIPQEKIEFYTEMAKYLPNHAVAVTNSSTLLPSTFAEYTGRPEKYLALHFANEIWKNNTAEVMGHPRTEQKYFDQVAEFASAIGMVPLKLNKEQPGYLLNSMLDPLLQSTQRLLANDVSDHETIDKTWRLAIGAPPGPFQIIDVVGLTTAYNIGSMSPGSEDPTSENGKVLAMLKKYIDEGKTGVNAGEGFYKYK